MDGQAPAVNICLLQTFSLFVLMKYIQDYGDNKDLFYGSGSLYVLAIYKHRFCGPSVPSRQSEMLCSPYMIEQAGCVKLINEGTSKCL